jgi:hypothetical protein
LQWRFGSVSYLRCTGTGGRRASPYLADEHRLILIGGLKRYMPAADDGAPSDEEDSDLDDDTPVYETGVAAMKRLRFDFDDTGPTPTATRQNSREPSNQAGRAASAPSATHAMTSELRHRAMAQSEYVRPPLQGPASIPHFYSPHPLHTTMTSLLQHPAARRRAQSASPPLSRRWLAPRAVHFDEVRLLLNISSFFKTWLSLKHSSSAASQLGLTAVDCFLFPHPGEHGEQQ